MEHAQDRKSKNQRHKELGAIIHHPASVLEYIAKLVENAYIAGAKGLNCQSKEAISVGNGRDQTPVETAARIYTKDKGLRP